MLLSTSICRGSTAEPGSQPGGRDKKRRRLTTNGLHRTRTPSISLPVPTEDLMAASRSFRAAQAHRNPPRFGHSGSRTTACARSGGSQHAWVPYLCSTRSSYSDISAIRLRIGPPSTLFSLEFAARMRQTLGYLGRVVATGRNASPLRRRQMMEEKCGISPHLPRPDPLSLPSFPSFLVSQTTPKVQSSVSNNTPVRLCLRVNPDPRFFTPSHGRRANQRQRPG